MAWNLCTHFWRMQTIWDMIYSGSLQHSWAPVPMNLNFWLQEELEISLCLFSAINFSPLISLQLRKIKEFVSFTVISVSHQCSVKICNWPLTTSSIQLIPDRGCSCISALQKCNQSVTWLSSHTCYEIVKLHILANLLYIQTSLAKLYKMCSTFSWLKVFHMDVQLHYNVLPASGWGRRWWEEEVSPWITAACRVGGGEG